MWVVSLKIFREANSKPHPDGKAEYNSATFSFDARDASALPLALSTGNAFVVSALFQPQFS